MGWGWAIGQGGCAPTEQAKEEEPVRESAHFSFQILPQPGKGWEGVAPTELPGILEHGILPDDPALPPHLTHLFLGAP